VEELRISVHSGDQDLLTVPGEHEVGDAVAKAGVGDPFQGLVAISDVPESRRALEVIASRGEERSIR
jgi:hypothetical protein